MGWRFHRPENSDQFIIFQLRLIDQYIDADGFGAKRIEALQRLRHNPPVQWRTLVGEARRFVGIRHHQDALVLSRFWRGKNLTVIEQGPLRVLEQRNIPALQGHKKGKQQPRKRDQAPRPADLAQIDGDAA